MFVSDKDNAQLYWNFGQQIMSVRTRLGVSIAELSLRSGIDAAHITRLEKGRSNPTLLTLARICVSLNIEMDELCKGFKLPPDFKAKR